ncbi:phage portal protein [Eubacterium sp. ER2]|uniref:phage portal protein n=1 Tax=Eubacterium sp. ER2 TaxID=1519438 RepID=UPI0009DF0A0E|nr:phage portal protein [Eubacterium sp. ER2]
MFRLEDDEILDEDRLGRFLAQHAAEATFRYKPLMDAYMTEYPIFREPPKPKYKPDNRIAVNFAKYIVDTMNGFFIGVPIKLQCDDDKVSEYVEFLDQYNDQDDNNAELSKICSIYGKGYEMYFVDQEGKIGITYLDPQEAFMIYDDSVIERPRYFVRTYLDSKNVLHGSVSDDEKVRYFVQKGKIQFIDECEKEHGFSGVPATEYRENAEEQGIFEPVLTMINAYNKAISEKANDVDYFADAYMKILGAMLDEEEIKHIRDDRIINFDEDADRMIVDFLQKPDGDTTQEHLIDRLERLIFQISMVADISDENFGTSSGIALKYKLQAMSNLAKTKERKFNSGMNRRYMLIFSNPVSGMLKNDWVKVKPIFTRNFPANVLEETEIAGNLEGIVSKKTQLSTLSIVDTVGDELERIEAEESTMKNDAVMRQMFGNSEGGSAVSAAETEVQGKSLNGAQTQSLLAIMAQYSAGSLTEGQAIALISTAIGISKEEARSILNGEL